MLLRLGLRLLERVAIEGIDDELPVGHAVTRRLVEGSLHILDMHLGDTHLMVQERHEVDIGCNLSHLQEQTLLTVFDIEALQAYVPAEEVEIQVFNSDTRLQLLREVCHHTRHHLVLYIGGIQRDGGNQEEHQHCYDKTCEDLEDSLNNHPFHEKSPQR